METYKAQVQRPECEDVRVLEQFRSSGNHSNHSPAAVSAPPWAAAWIACTLSGLLVTTSLSVTAASAAWGPHPSPVPHSDCRAEVLHRGRDGRGKGRDFKKQRPPALSAHGDHLWAADVDGDESQPVCHLFGARWTWASRNNRVV